MKDNRKYNTSQLFNFASDSYLDRTSRPVYALVFLLPFLIFYELGILFIKTDVLIDSFVWLQRFLGELGFTSRFALGAPPVAVVVILLALQFTSKKRWAVWLPDMFPMAIECILLAVPLIVLTLFLNTSPAPKSDFAAHEKIQQTFQTDAIGYASVKNNIESNNCMVLSQPTPKDSLLAKIVTGMGAGIYEELVFRLILICVLMILFQDLIRLSHNSSIILSILISAALFSAHHHINFLNGQINQAEVFRWTVFAFRTIAGIYFAGLFAMRGFGIAAGTHAFYDIIAVSINAAYFEQ